MIVAHGNHYRHLEVFLYTPMLLNQIRSKFVDNQIQVELLVQTDQIMTHTGNKTIGIFWTIVYIQRQHLPSDIPYVDFLPCNAEGLTLAVQNKSHSQNNNTKFYVEDFNPKQNER